MYQQHILLKLRKPILKYTLNKYHVHWLTSFKNLNLPISIKIPVTIWQIVYIYMTAIRPGPRVKKSKVVTRKVARFVIV